MQVDQSIYPQCENDRLQEKMSKRICIKWTLSAASLSFFAAIDGRNEYGNIIALRLFRSLHSMNLEGHDQYYLRKP